MNTPTPQEFAARLHGRTYPLYLTKTEAAEAKAAGLVVVYGASDDLMEFEGAMSDELGACDGTTATVSSAGPLVSWDSLDKDDEAEVQAYFDKKRGAREIEAIWCPAEPEGASWAYRTDIPHATFDVMEDGAIYCRGIVFCVSELSAAALAAPPVPAWQPIETAPQDGVYQDGRNHYSEFMLVWQDGFDKPRRARWWWRDDGNACNWIADGGFAVFPTHWMHLPTPPKEQA